jgi:uncharacterized protein involved in oxidation of intracellular sulfur
MKLALIVHATDPEILWNGFRLGLFALKAGDEVAAFLLARGVESERHADPPFHVKDMMQQFADAGGRILACGTCLQLRHSQGTELCPLSTMKDLYELIRDADRIVTI